MVEFEDEDEDGFVDALMDEPLEEDLVDDDAASVETVADVAELEIADDGEVVDPASDFGDDFDEAGVALPPTATFDGDDETPVVIEEDEDDSDDAVREGEFICRSCFMAKRDSALADEERVLCLDCV